MSSALEPVGFGRGVDSLAGREATAEGCGEVGVDEMAPGFEHARHLGDRVPPVGDVVGRARGHSPTVHV